MLDRPKGKSGHLILKADNKKEQKMPKESGQNQISAVITSGIDLVQVLSIQITVISTGQNRNQHENEQERENENRQ